MFRYFVSLFSLSFASLIVHTILNSAPAVSGGVDIPLSNNFTGTVRLNAGFPSNRNADIGMIIGAGYSFGK
jgi:hypothetical protein